MALTQARFAQLMRQAMGDEVGDSELAARTRDDGWGKPAIDRKTIANYQRADYPSGPPDSDTRRRLERALEVYRNYFEGAWTDVPVVEQKRLIRRGEAPAAATHSAPLNRVAETLVGYEADELPESSGLELEDEEHLRDFLRAITLTTKGDTKPRESKVALRYLRLGALEAYEHSVKRRGQPVPRYFRTIRREIEHDRFE